MSRVIGWLLLSIKTGGGGESSSQEVIDACEADQTSVLDERPFSLSETNMTNIAGNSYE